MDSMLDKRERILAAAATLIVDNGLKCSMSAIAEEANVATGSLYNYFTSKEDLVRGVYGRVAEVMTERVVVEHHSETSHRDRVRHYIGQYINFIWEDPHRARLFDYLANNPLVTLSEAQDIFGAFSKHSVDMLAAAQDAGVVRPGPADLMSSFLRGAIRNTLKHRRFNPKPLALAEREHLTAMCWDSIAANGN